jgi:hypothetical protein
MALEDLMAVVPPPAHPRDAGDLAAWTAMEEKLGTRLPEDFRDFCLYYGSGAFNDPGRLCIFVRNPLAPDFEARFCQDVDWLRLMKGSASDDDFPYGVFPPLPGLILWAEDDNGCMLFWLTEGQPDRWPIVVTPPRGYFWERFDLPMTWFLARAFSWQLTCVPWHQPEFFSGPRKVKFAQDPGDIEYQ